MKKILIIISLINTFLATSLLSTELEFSSDYNEAMKEAQREQKDVYMFIASSTCRWCRKFEERTLTNISLINKIEEKYVILHITRDFDDIPQRFDTTRVPKHYFLSNKGKVIHSFLGYWNVEDFSSFLDDVQKRRKRIL